MTEDAQDIDERAPRLWLRWLLLAAGIAGIIALAMLGPESPERPKRKPPQISVAIDADPVEPAPLTFQPNIAAADAEAMNAERPDFMGVVVAARPFIAPRTIERQADLQRAIECLTQTVYYEAASEPPEGQRAVAQVVLNRVRDPRFPASVCGVVYQGSERSTGCQFTFTCDGALSRRPDPFLYTRARLVAVAALAGRTEPFVGLATHYHTKQVVPYWRTDLVKLRTIGAHIFYSWKGRERSARGLRSDYSGVEPVVASASLAPALDLGIVPTIDPADDTATNPVAVPLPDVGPRAPRLPTQDYGRMRADERRGELNAGTGTGNAARNDATPDTGALEADRKAGTLARP